MYMAEDTLSICKLKGPWGRVTSWAIQCTCTVSRDGVLVHPSLSCESCPFEGRLALRALSQTRAAFSPVLNCSTLCLANDMPRRPEFADPLYLNQVKLSFLKLLRSRDLELERWEVGDLEGLETES